jgi:hypothetical protein
MKMSSKHIAGMLLGGLVTLSAAVAPAAAQGLSVTAPTTQRGPDGSAWRPVLSSSSAGVEGKSRSATSQSLGACVFA